MSEKSIIDGVLSTHFDECSIAAADAAKAVSERVFDHNEAPLRLQPIGRFFHNQVEYYHVNVVAEDVEVQHELVSGGKVTLALAKHSAIEEFPISLVAIFNSDAMLPIASFEQRTDGRCSYVQIGQEIEGDNLVVTANTPRSQQIEAIRAVVKHEMESNNAESLDDIKKIITSEIESYAGQIEEALLPSVLDLAVEYFDKSEKHKETLNVVTNCESSPYMINVQATELSFMTEETNDTINSHKVRLLLAEEISSKVAEKGEKRSLFKRKTKNGDIEDNPQDLVLFASIRGNMAIPLLKFHKDTGFITTEFSDEEINLASTEILSALLQVFHVDNTHIGLLKKLRVRQQIINNRDGMYYLLFYAPTRNSSEESVRVERKPDGSNCHFDCDVNLIFRSSNAYSWETFKNSVETGLNDAYVGFGQRGVPRFKAALASRADEKMSRLISLTKLRERLGQLFDSGETEHEKVISQVLGRLATTSVAEYEGVLHDRKAGKTMTDVMTRVALSNGGHQLRVQVQGRPVALEGFSLASIFDESFRLDGKNSHLIDKEIADEISGVITSICGTIEK